MSDIPRLFSGLAVVLLLLVVGATFSYQTAWDSPEPHPTIPAMEVGGERSVDDADHWALGIVFGGTIILMFSASLLLAPEVRQRFKLRVAIYATSALFLTIFIAMLLLFRSYAIAETPTLFGPFPAPTTLMLFGVWCVPMIFAAIYSLGFNAWFAEDEDVPADDGFASNVGDAK